MELRETQRAVAPFGGLVVFFEFLRRIGYGEAVRPHLPFTLRSSNAIEPVKTFAAFLLSVVAGARPFAHTSLLRADTALHALLGISRFPIDDTVRNLFKRFGEGQCQLFCCLWVVEWRCVLLAPCIPLRGPFGPSLLAQLLRPLLTSAIGSEAISRSPVLNPRPMADLPR